jgi:hypothetical protein
MLKLGDEEANPDREQRPAAQGTTAIAAPLSAPARITRASAFPTPTVLIVLRLVRAIHSHDRQE